MNLLEYEVAPLMSAEEAALAKAKNILCSPQYFTHGFNRNSKYGDRLQSALIYGLLSPNFGEKVGIDIETNYGGAHDSVCINYPGGDAIIEGFGYSCWGSYPQPSTTKDLCVLMISAKTYYKKWPYSNLIDGGPMKNEARWRWRIAPRNFEGVIIADTEFNVGWEDLDNLKITPVENAVEEISNMMKDTFRTHPDLAIPIYGTSGELYWPKKSHTLI